MKNILFRCPIGLLPLVGLLLLFQGGAAWGQVLPPRGSDAARPVREALNSDGTLRPGASGAFDPAGFRMEKGPRGEPVFRPTGAGDEHWVDGFGLPGTNNYVYATAVAANGDVYIGGIFTAAGTVPANCIAKWNGSAWSALGLSLNARVRALAVSGADAYVGAISPRPAAQRPIA